LSTEQKNQANTEQEVDATYNENAEAEAADAGQDESNAQEQAGLTPEQQEIEKLKLQADEHHQRLLRAQADFDNFRSRTRQEKEEFAKYASLKVVEQLLPVVDNFERALAAGKDSNDYDALIKGVDMIFRQLDQVLAAEGLTRMETVGQPFNPEFHQAVMQVESDEHEEGIVVEELQKGYLLKDKVLRPAMVKVSS